MEFGGPRVAHMMLGLVKGVVVPVKSRDPALKWIAGTDNPMELMFVLALAQKCLDPFIGIKDMKFVEINFVAAEVEANSFKNRFPCALADMNESDCWFVEACSQNLGGFRIERRAFKLAEYIHCAE